MKRITLIKKILTGLAFSKTARNTYLVFFGNGLSAFFAFVFTVTLFRQLSVSDFGYWSAILSFLLLVSDLSDIGIGSSLSAFLPPLEIDRERLLSFLKTAFYLQSLISILVTVILLMLTPFLSEAIFHGKKFQYLMVITDLGVFSAIIGNFFQYALSARQKFTQVSFLSAFGGLIRLVMLIGLIFISKVSLLNTVWLQIWTLIVTALVAAVFLEFSFISRKRIPGDMKKLIKFTAFLGASRGLTAVASRLDVLMLISLTNSTEAGIYGTASRVISIYPLLSGSFSTVLAPRLSAIKSPGELKKFMYKVTLGTAGLIGSDIFLILIAYPFMTVLFGMKAAPAVSVFQLLLFSMIFFIGSIPPVSLAIYYLRKPHILTVNSVLQLLIVIFGNLYFIPRYGRLGPAFSLIVAYGLTLFTTAVIVYVYIGKKHAER